MRVVKRGFDEVKRIEPGGVSEPKTGAREPRSRAADAGDGRGVACPGRRR